jgi:hypothetical protein
MRRQWDSHGLSAGKRERRICFIRNAIPRACNHRVTAAGGWSRAMRGIS